MSGNTDVKKSARSQVYLTLKILWGTMLFSILVLCFVRYFIHGQQAYTHGAETAEALEMPFTVVAAVIAFVSLFISRKFALLKSSGGGQTGVESERIGTLAGRFSPEFQRFFTFSVVTWALNESITIIGFTLSILSNDPMDMLIFVVVSLFLMVRMFPADKEE